MTRFRTPPRHRPGPRSWVTVVIASTLVATGGGVSVAQPITTSPAPPAAQQELAPANICTGPTVSTTTSSPTSTPAPSSTPTVPCPPGTSSATAAPQQEPTGSTSGEPLPPAAPTPGLTPSAESTEPSPAGARIPYTGLPTENPNSTIVPGKMRSDREEWPAPFTKEDADRAEVREAELQRLQSQQGAARAIPQPGPDCQQYWPSENWVCGAIRDKYNSLGAQFSFLTFPTSEELVNPDNYGRRQTFLNGPIYWSPHGGAHPVVNHFFAAWQRQGWESGILGYPLTDEIVNPDGVGRRQEFDGAGIYWHLNEAYAIGGALRTYWNGLGAEQGELGYPVTDELATAGNETGYGQVMNRFEMGSLYYDFPTSRVRHGRWIFGVIPPTFPDEYSIDAQADGTEPIPQNDTSDNATTTPDVSARFQTPCDPATTGYTGADSKYNCVYRFVDLDGTGINVRQGTVAGFGQLHYKRHWVEDRWVELVLQDNSITLDPNDTEPGSTRGAYAMDFFVGDQYDFEDHMLGIKVAVQLESGGAPDGKQFGVITAFCYLPNGNQRIPTCPEQMPPGPFYRTVGLGE